MNNENEKGREHHLRQRIVSLIWANEQALKKPITDEEVQKLEAAAARLDQLLEDIGTGKDVTYDDLTTRIVSVIGAYRREGLS
jgi:hypothetical protein